MTTPSSTHEPPTRDERRELTRWARKVLMWSSDPHTRSVARTALAEMDQSDRLGKTVEVVAAQRDEALAEVEARHVQMHDFENQEDELRETIRAVRAAARALLDALPRCPCRDDRREVDSGLCKFTPYHHDEIKALEALL